MAVFLLGSLIPKFHVTISCYARGFGRHSMVFHPVFNKTNPGWLQQGKLTQERCEGVNRFISTPVLTPIRPSTAIPMVS